MYLNLGIDMTNKEYPKYMEDWCNFPVIQTDTELIIGGWQVMQAWEQPIMQVLAHQATKRQGDILEIGFGMGISATAILERGCNSYTVIEAHPVIVEKAHKWAEQYNTPITIINGFWQNVIPNLTSRFDGIVFDTYPLKEEERSRNHFDFIPIAPSLLRVKGVLTYYSDENLNFRSDHLKLLLSYFDEVKLIKVSGLKPPPDCEYWQSDTMIVPAATKLV